MSVLTTINYALVSLIYLKRIFTNMEQFKIYKTDNGLYRYIFRKQLDLSPVFLFGYEQPDRESCKQEINLLQQQLLTPGSFSFISNRKGYRFLIFSQTGKPLGFSCFFETQKKMKSALDNLQSWFSSNAEKELSLKQL
jgi:hypothetical protein